MRANALPLSYGYLATATTNVVVMLLMVEYCCEVGQGGNG